MWMWGWKREDAEELSLALEETAKRFWNRERPHHVRHGREDFFDEPLAEERGTLGLARERQKMLAPTRRASEPGKPPRSRPHSRKALTVGCTTDRMGPKRGSKRSSYEYR
jgi:hypothetical protein